MVRIHVGQPNNRFTPQVPSRKHRKLRHRLTNRFLPLVPPQRFNQTMSMLMSAGDTPEMRAAWPMVVGRIFESFCRASKTQARHR